MSFHQDLLETKSPFRLPTDEEVFITREAERLQKQEIKEKIKSMKKYAKSMVKLSERLQRQKGMI